jgi:hypothetical protein
VGGGGAFPGAGAFRGVAGGCAPSQGWDLHMQSRRCVHIFGYHSTASDGVHVRASHAHMWTMPSMWGEKERFQGPGPSGRGWRLRAHPMVGPASAKKAVGCAQTSLSVRGCTREDEAIFVRGGGAFSGAGAFRGVAGGGSPSQWWGLQVQERRCVPTSLDSQYV